MKRDLPAAQIDMDLHVYGGSGAITLDVYGEHQPSCGATEFHEATGGFHVDRVMWGDKDITESLPASILEALATEAGKQ